MKKPDRRMLWIAGATLVVAALLYLVFRPESVDVETAAVDRGPVEVLIEEDGETRVRERFVVSAPVTGRMDRLTCSEGDLVQAGQVLARIYPLPLDTRGREEAAQRLQQAEAAARAARAAVAEHEAIAGEARRSLERLQRLAAAAPGSVSRQAMDELETAERTAALALEQARDLADAELHQVGSARATMLGAAGDRAVAPMPVRAPATGRILRLYEECERVVTTGSPILEIGDPADLEVVVDVLTEDAASLREAAPARISAGGDTLAARVRRIEPSAFTRVSPLGVEEQRVNVVIAFEETPLLGDRFRVDAQIVVSQTADALRVPVSALFRADGDWAVFVAEDDRVRIQRIQLGNQGRMLAEVRAGLEEGDHVVVFPSETLRDGTRID